MPPEENSQIDSIPVHRGRVDSIKVYEVTESELAELKRGGGGSIFLNFALSLGSIAITLFVAILTTTIASDRQYYVFWILAILLLLGAIVFGVLWWTTRKTIATVVATIQGRMPSEDSTDRDPDDEAVDKAS